MKFSQQWLYNFLQIDLDIKTISNKLTEAGLEVSSVKPVSGNFKEVIIGQIKTINQHPNADKLKICSVDIGNNTLLPIICSATNIYYNMKVPVAIISAILPGNYKIKKSKIRGQISYGMMCSEKELEISKFSEGLMELPKDAPLGKCLREYLSLDDTIIEIDVTPNRADCLSLYGIAREVSAITNTSLNTLSIKKQRVKHNQIKSVISDDTQSCFRYFSRLIIGIDSKVKTPLWIKERLRRSGIENNSIIIDILNYVLLIFGQPVNAFDANQIEGQIKIRYAKKGEKIVLLNQKEITLDSKTLVISDLNKILSIAGVIGGYSALVTSNTNSILLESAYFNPEIIRGKSKYYGLNTESSYRYERGVDPMITEYVIEYATQLIIEITGGKAGKITSVTKKTAKTPIIDLRLDKINRVLGSTLNAFMVENILKRLDMTILSKNKNWWTIKPPSYRFDIIIEADLIEEVVRLYGFTNLKVKMPKLTLQLPKKNQKILTLSEFKILMVNRGYHQVINYSFIASNLNSLFSKNSSINISNPISQEMNVMRQSLIPGLLLNYKNNLNRKQSRIRLFEEGKCFFYNMKIKDNTANKYQEREYFSALAWGNLLPINSRQSSYIDFYHVKSDVEALLNNYKNNFTFRICENIDWLHPGKSAYLYQGEKIVGLIGVIHPKIMKLIKIKSKQLPIVFELYFDNIILEPTICYQKISKFPPIFRDISLIVDREIEIQLIIDAIKRSKIYILQEINVFDIYYDDKKALDNKKNIAIRLMFQHMLKTLTDKEISYAMEKILESVSNFTKAILRDS